MRPIPAVLLLLTLPTALSAQAMVKNPVANRTLTAVPTGPPPGSLVATPAATSISLRWTCPDGATGFDVYATGSNGAQTKLNPTPVPAPCVQDLQASPVQLGRMSPTSLSSSPTYSQRYTHAGLVPGSSYSYVVVALYANGATGASPPAGAQTTPHPAPGGFSAAPSGRSAQLSWGAVPSATGYQVFRRLAGQPAFQPQINLPASTISWSDGTILPPGTHHYYVQALLGQPAAAATVTMPPWPAPADFRVTELPSRINLQWTRVPGVTDFQVFRMRQGETGFSQANALPLSFHPTAGYTPFYNDPNPVMARQVSYFVKAVGGEPTPIVAVTPGVPYVSQITVFCGRGTLDFRWGGMGDGGNGKILRGGTAAGPFVHAAEYPGRGADFVRIIGNPVAVMQYYKLQVTYPTGVTESVVVPLTIPADAKGMPAWNNRSPVPGTTAEYQCN